MPWQVCESELFCIQSLFFSFTLYSSSPGFIPPHLADPLQDLHLPVDRAHALSKGGLEQDAEHPPWEIGDLEKLEQKPL